MHYRLVKSLSRLKGFYISKFTTIFSLNFVSSKLLFSVFLARLIVVVSACLVCNSSIVATCPPIPAAHFAFRLCFIPFVFLVRSCCIWWTKAEARARVGRPQTSSSPPPPPVIFIAGRPKAALLLWFFGEFRCGALLFVVIHVIYKYKNR